MKDVSINWQPDLTLSNDAPPASIKHTTQWAELDA